MRLGHRVPRMMPLQHVRCFHQTRPAPFINEAVDAASTFVHGVHSISHLPWALSIPLTAVVIRMGVAFPLLVFTKVQARKESEMAPILMAWRQHHQKQIQRSAGANGPMLAREAKAIATKNVKAEYDALRRRWGVVPYYRPAIFLQLPIWLAVIESIRALSGDKNGLRALFGLQESAASTAATGTLPAAVEPSLATEGALWFPDLLAGDPTGMLPALLTLSLLVNIRNGWKVQSLRSCADLPRKEMVKKMSSTLLRSVFQLLALNLGLAAYVHGLPAAVMIYWITSTNVATAQTFLLQKYMFPTPALKTWTQIHIGLSQRGRKALSRN
ncbi:hypothetical protein BDW74DRAFT_170727 [Aspergillus multicolor]|uniref:putative mitochondrial export translocase Oxa2 n=1 Tax=Aspergillus multicolor TaxID=41759 RepID=UPI003CCD5575